MFSFFLTVSECKYPLFGSQTGQIYLFLTHNSIYFNSPLQVATLGVGPGETLGQQDRLTFLVNKTGKWSVYKLSSSLLCQ